MTTGTKRKLGAMLTLVGLVVALLPVMASATTPPPNSNEVGFWCAAGIKYDGVNAATFTVPEPPEGYVWTKLILKAGSTGSSVDEENFVILNPVVGQAYSWQGTLNGQAISKDISHAILCKEVVTTTTPPDDDEETTTTSTTVVDTTTTTVPDTTTVPGSLEAVWSASSTCETLTAVFGEGIVRIDLYQRLPEGDFGPADGIVPFTESGQVIDTEGAFADSEWLLIPVVETGYVAVPESITLFTEICATTTTVPDTTPSTGPTDSTLPFTGVESGAMVGLGAGALALGSLLLFAVRREET